MFQTFRQAWGKSIQNVISSANESVPKIEETIKVLSSELSKNPQSELLVPKLNFEPPPQPVILPVVPAQAVPAQAVPAQAVPAQVAPTQSHTEQKLIQPTLEPKLIKMSRVISTQTLEARKEEKPEYKESKECKVIEKEVISLDYHWNVLKLMFIMHVVSLLIVAFLAFKR